MCVYVSVSQLPHAWQVRLATRPLGVQARAPIADPRAPPPGRREHTLVHILVDSAADLDKWGDNKFRKSAGEYSLVGAKDGACFDKDMYTMLKRLTSGMARDIVDPPALPSRRMVPAQRLGSGGYRPFNVHAIRTVVG